MPGRFASVRAGTRRITSSSVAHDNARRVGEEKETRGAAVSPGHTLLFDAHAPLTQLGYTPDVPLPQPTQDSRSLEKASGAGHASGAHDVAPAFVLVPSGQFEHESAPSDAENLPGGHSVHAVSMLDPPLAAP